jgi:hypothetical protein
LISIIKGGDSIADISMCKNESCVKKDTCYRYRASPGEYQVYMEFQNICNEKNEFKWYWEMEVKEEGK